MIDPIESWYNVDTELGLQNKDAVQKSKSEIEINLLWNFDDE